MIYLSKVSLQDGSNHRFPMADVYSYFSRNIVLFFTVFNIITSEKIESKEVNPRTTS